MLNGGDRIHKSRAWRSCSAATAVRSARLLHSFHRCAAGPGLFGCTLRSLRLHDGAVPQWQQPSQQRNYNTVIDMNRDHAFGVAEQNHSPMAPYTSVPYLSPTVCLLTRVSYKHRKFICTSWTLGVVMHANACLETRTSLLCRWRQLKLLRSQLSIGGFARVQAGPCQVSLSYGKTASLLICNPDVRGVGCRLASSIAGSQDNALLAPIVP